MGGWLLLKLVVLVLPAVGSFASAEADRPEDRPCPPGRSDEWQCSARQQSGGRDVHVIRVSPGETERLTDEGGNHAGLVCSPEGRRIAYGKGGDTYVMYYDGHSKRCVLDGSDSVERWP